MEILIGFIVGIVMAALLSIVLLLTATKIGMVIADHLIQEFDRMEK